MRSWPLEISHEAEKVLKRQEKSLRLRLRDAIDRLAVDPYPGPGRDVSPIKGKANVWTMRVGGWRILYTIDEVNHTVYVAAIHPRGQAYRQLPER